MNNFAAQFCPERMRVWIERRAGISISRDDDEPVANQIVETAFSVVRRDLCLTYMHPAAAPVAVPTDEPYFECRHAKRDEVLLAGLIQLFLESPQLIVTDAHFFRITFVNVLPDVHAFDDGRPRVWPALGFIGFKQYGRGKSVQ